MDVHIDEVVASVRAVDPSVLADPAVVERIVAAVIDELDRRSATEHRLRAERGIGRGVEGGPSAGWRSGG